MNRTDSVYRRAFYLLALLMIALAAYVADAQEQTTPPPPTAPRSPQIPKPVERTLANGLRVIVVERRNVPLVSAAVYIKNGGEVDPPQLAGLADMTASLLTKGTNKRSAPAIAEAIEALGGTLDSGAGWDNSSASLNVMSARFPAALAILAEVVRQPTFKDEEIERLRQQYLDELQVALGDPGQLARLVTARIVFGDSPYGHPLAGTPESIARITRADIARLHQTYYRPDNAVLVIGGDIRPAAAFRLATQQFGNWAKPAAKLPAAAAPAATAARQHNAARIVVIDKPDAGQAAVYITRLGLRRADPDYYRGLVANSVLSGYSGRLNQEIRIKRGLSYGARSALEVRRDVGPFSASAQTKNETGAQVVGLLLGELGRLAAGDLPEAELTPRKAVLIGNFARNLETSSGLVAQIGSLALYGLSLDEINHYINSVQAVTAADVQRFAGTRLPVKETSVVIVGNAKLFLPELRQQYPNAEVIPAAELDLNSAALRKRGN